MQGEKSLCITSTVKFNLLLKNLYLLTLASDISWWKNEKQLSCKLIHFIVFSLLWLCSWLWNRGGFSPCSSSFQICKPDKNLQSAQLFCCCSCRRLCGLWEEQGITSVYQTPTGKKHSLYFQLCFFSHTTIVLAFGSVVVADLGFTMCFVEGVRSSFPGH